MELGPTMQEYDRINAGTMMIEAIAVQHAERYVAIVARLLRQILPTAASLLVDISGWYYPDEHGSGDVDLRAVLDVQHCRIWRRDQDTSEPPGLPGTAEQLIASVERLLVAALDHLTPSGCGWVPEDRGRNTYRIELPPPPISPSPGDAAA